MKRKDFLKMCSILGIGYPLQLGLKSCAEDDMNSGMSANPDQKVIIIGAGPAGMSAAYLLEQLGIEYQLIEASNNYGGRIKTKKDFVDFPIPLGGEWIHVDASVLDEIVNDTNINLDVMTAGYDPQTDFGLFEGQQISMADVGFTIDRKFVNHTWLTFYEEYILPSIQNKITYNAPIESINYESDEIVIKSSSEEFRCDKLIVTVPVKMLQMGSVNFTPELPASKQEALSEITVWDGFKAFIEFSEKFYPAAIAFDIAPASAGQKLYYDASHGQNSDRHVLGLFSVGTGTKPYADLEDQDLINYMLNELDEMFDGKATEAYLQHTSQNWNKEPFIQGAYITDQENWRQVRTLGESVDDKIYFAGTSYTTGNDWSSVHTAARSAKRAVEEIVS